VTFFPHTLLPLHVFEARDRRLSVVKLRPGYEKTYEGKPAVHAVAGAGEIVSCERLPTGRYNILLKGLWRIRIERELPADVLYRVVRAQRLDDVPASDVTAPLARVRASCARLLDVLGRPANLLDEALAQSQSPGAIADRVTAAVVPDASIRQELLETLDVGARVTRLAAVLDHLVNELTGGREP
jgi:uncharacterized protein